MRTKTLYNALRRRTLPESYHVVTVTRPSVISGRDVIVAEYVSLGEPDIPMMTRARGVAERTARAYKLAARLTVEPFSLTEAGAAVVGTLTHDEEVAP